VFHEYVMVDEEPGRWKTAAEAKAAAETTYAELLAAGHPGPPEVSPPSKRRGFVASLVHGWRDGRR
jgi:hypothetical protein